MLLTRQRKQPELPTLNMAAMVDIVFLLNVFFLCTASAIQLEKEIPTPMPQVRTAPEAAREFDPVRIRLSRAAEGVLVTCDNQPCATFHDLATMLRARRAIADVPVIIQGEGAVPFGKMVAALDTCHRADLRKVAFSAQGAGP